MDYEWPSKPVSWPIYDQLPDNWFPCAYSELREFNQETDLIDLVSAWWRVGTQDFVMVHRFTEVHMRSFRLGPDLTVALVRGDWFEELYRGCNEPGRTGP